MELAELESIGPVEFGRRPASGQTTLFDESDVERETKPHDTKRPGEFTPKPKKPKTSGGQMLLVDSGVSDHPIERKPVESAMPPEVTAPKQPEPLGGQRELFQARHVTETPEFKAWHSGSHVIDGEGKPLVVYHATAAGGDFDKFQSTTPQSVYKLGGKEIKKADAEHLGDDRAGHPDRYHYGAVSDALVMGPEKALEFRRKDFARYPDSLDAKRYLHDLERMQGMPVTSETERRPDGSGSWHSPSHDYNFIAGAYKLGENARIIPSYLSLKNPAYLNGAEIESAGRPWFRDKLIAMGHDGAIYKPNKNDLSKPEWGEHPQIVAFHPHQVKSVFNKTFDPKDDRLNFSRDLESIGPVEFSVDPVHPFEKRYADAVNSSDYKTAQKHVDHAANLALTQHRNKWEQQGVSSFASAKDNSINLHEIRVPKEKQGQGLGTQYMKELQGFAGQHGMRVTLSPSTDFGASSKSRLTSFYRGLGFVPNSGRNKDFSTKEAMLWHPPTYNPKAWIFDRDQSGQVVPLQQKFGVQIPRDAEMNQFSRDWDESQHPRESEFHDDKHPGEFAPEGGNGHELAAENAARTERAQLAVSGKPPETFASNGQLPKPYQFWEQAPLSEVLGDIPQRPAWLRKRDQVAKMPWTDAHEIAQHAAAKYDVNIDDVVATMPAAHAHILDGMVERERAKADARKLTGVSARHEYADSDWSNIPRFDETSRSLAAMHPIIGIRPEDHYAPQKMWDFVREGKLKLPDVNSRETADMAASMLAMARRTGPIHFQSHEDEQPDDEWTVVHHGDADDSELEDAGGFDPSQFSRDSLDQTEGIEKLAERMGVDPDSLLAAIAEMPGPEQESLIWIRKLMHDPSRGILRDRNGHVVGFLTRNGKQIQLRDANSHVAGTVTSSGHKSIFRSRSGNVQGSVGEFSRSPRFEPADVEHYVDTIRRNVTMRIPRQGETPENTWHSPEFTPRHEAQARRRFVRDNVHLADVPVGLLNHNPGEVAPERMARLESAGGSQDPIIVGIDGMNGNSNRKVLNVDDGNNRVHYAKQRGLTHVPAFLHGTPGEIDSARQMIAQHAGPGPVEFARKPAAGQQSLAFEEPPQPTAAPAPEKQSTLPATVDFPETNTHPATKGVRVQHQPDGMTHFLAPENPWSLAKTPTHDAPRFLDEINGRLTHPANSGHATLDRVLSGQGRYLGKGHEAMVHDAGNGMVVKSAVITPFHINQGTRTREEANRIVSDTVDLSKNLRHRGIQGILPQYGVFHDGRMFAMQPKVDVEPKLTDEHIKQLEDTIHAVHNAGYVLRDQIQPGLDHNGRAALYDIGSAAKLEGKNPRWDEDDKQSDFSHLSYLASKHGLKYRTPRERSWDNNYDNLLFNVTSPKAGQEITDPKAANRMRAKLVTYERLMKTRDPDMHELYADHHAEAMAKLKAIEGQPVQMSRDPAAGQMSLWKEDEHPRAVDGKFADKLHHKIKEYLSDGTRRNLRDIHAHTGDIKTDAFDPTSNPTTAALKSLRDSGEISSQEPDYAEPMFHMTEEQKKKHADSVFVSPPQNVSEEADLKKKEVGRTRSAIHFDPPIVGPSGSQLTSYEWKYEWVMDDEKGPDPVRVSNWDEAEFNEHTKRNIVHSFGVTDDSGEHHTASLETAVKMLGLVKNSDELGKVKNLAQAAIKLAQAKQDHEKLTSSIAEQEKSRFKYRVSSSEEKIADLTAKMEFLNREAAMMNSGKSPVQHYRDVSRKLHALRAMFRTHNGSRWGSDRVTEFVKEAGGDHEEQRENRVAGYALYKDVVRANGMNVLGEETGSTPLPDGKPEATYFGRKSQAKPPWSDQKMRNWFSKHGEDAEVAIDKAHDWLKKHHPNYQSLIEHPDFAVLKPPKEFSREIGPVEFARRPADGQSTIDFDAPAREYVRETSFHENKRPGEFANSKPKKDKATTLRDSLGRVIHPTTGQVQARVGGEVSEVDGQHYKAGHWMPVHGLTPKTEAKPKAMATPGDSGAGKANEDAEKNRRYNEARVLPPEDLEAAQQKKADQAKWDEIKSGPLGKVKWLGDSPNAKGMHYLTSMNQWHDYAEAAGPAEIKRITGELESVWKSKVREAAKHEKDLPEDSIEYWMNTPKQQAEQEIGMYPRANGTHEKRIPGSAYARQLVQHLLDGNGMKSTQRPIDNMHDIHKILTGTYESEFSRDTGPVEFARHSFSSTQFNISEAGYSRSHGSPLPELKKLAASIPDDELADDGREDNFHITALFGLHDDTPEDVRDLVSDFGPVHVTLGKTSIFPAKEDADYDVVKIDIEGDDIHRLNKLLKTLDHTSTHPKYHPHLTLAYVKAGEGNKYVGKNPLTGREISFDALQFSNKDRKKTVISLIGDEPEFSRDEDWILAPFSDGPVEFARPIRPGAGQQSMGFSDDEQPHDVSSSNIHSFRLDPNGPGGGSLLVRYLNNKKDGPGPEYRYFTGGRSLYDRMKTDAAQGRSMGGFVWDHLRIRGSVAGHQVPFELAGTGPDKYVPRAAGLKRGHTGEWFNKRTFQGQESNLAPGPVRKSNGPMPGYDPNKLKLPGEKPAAAPAPQPKPAVPQPAAPTPTPAPASPSPAPAKPQTPPATPPKKPGLVDRILGLFRRKPKDQKPKEFSREEIRDIETVYSALFREPANLKFDERRNAV